MRTTFTNWRCSENNILNVQGLVLAYLHDCRYSRPESWKLISLDQWVILVWIIKVLAWIQFHRINYFNLNLCLNHLCFDLKRANLNMVSILSISTCLNVQGLVLVYLHDFMALTNLNCIINSIRICKKVLP